MEKNRHMGETSKTLSDRIDELEATRTGAGPSLRDRLHRADAGPPPRDRNRLELIQYDDMRDRTLQDRAKDFLVKHQLVPEAVSQKWEASRLDANDRALTAWEASPEGKQWVADKREEAAANYENAKHEAYVERKSEEYALNRGVQLAEDEGIRKHEKKLALEESRSPTLPQKKQVPSHSPSKPKDRDFDMEM